jgi:hypothetical protein
MKDPQPKRIQLDVFHEISGGLFFPGSGIGCHDNRFLRRAALCDDQLIRLRLADDLCTGGAFNVAANNPIAAIKTMDFFTLIPG